MDEDTLPGSHLDASLRIHRLQKVCDWVHLVTLDPDAAKAADAGWLMELIKEELERLEIQVNNLYKRRAAA